MHATYLFLHTHHLPSFLLPFICFCLSSAPGHLHHTPASSTPPHFLLPAFGLLLLFVKHVVATAAMDVDRWLDRFETSFCVVSQGGLYYHFSHHSQG